MEGLEIYCVELYRKVRLARSEGMSQRQCALHFGVSRDMIRKMDNRRLPSSIGNVPPAEAEQKYHAPCNAITLPV